MARRRKRRARFGASAQAHDNEARQSAKAVEYHSKKVIKLARGGACGPALTAYYTAQQNFGAAYAEAQHVGGVVPGLGKASRFMHVAGKVFRAKCLVKR